MMTNIGKTMGRSRIWTKSWQSMITVHRMYVCHWMYCTWWTNGCDVWHTMVFAACFLADFQPPSRNGMTRQRMEYMEWWRMAGRFWLIQKSANKSYISRQPPAEMKMRLSQLNQCRFTRFPNGQFPLSNLPMNFQKRSLPRLVLPHISPRPAADGYPNWVERTLAGGGLGARSIGSAKGKGSKWVLGIGSAKQIKSSKLCIDEKLETDSGMGTGASIHNHPFRNSLYLYHVYPLYCNILWHSCCGCSAAACQGSVGNTLN